MNVPSRSKAAQPFTVAKPLSEAFKTVDVLDAAGEPFCIIHAAHCIGGDLAAAKARAQRIAEALNRV